MVSESLIFECPVDAKVRIFLRYEYLQQAVQNLIARKGLELETIKALQELSSLVSSSNIKNILLITLQSQADALQRFSEGKKADRRKALEQMSLIAEAQEQVNAFFIPRAVQEHYLRDAIRLRSGVATGTCSFDFPVFSSWLHTSQVEKERDMRSWYEPFKKLNTGISGSLSLTRLSGHFEEARTESGRFSKEFSATRPPSMLRLKMRKQRALFPEFSVGKHRMHLYFREISDYAQQPRSTDQVVEFQLAMSSL